jgi:hypothetical protein
MTTLTSLTELETAVATGTAYLDAHYPGWRARVDGGAVEAACPDHSVTGQLFGPRIVDQLRAVGIDPEATTTDGFDEVCTFASMGFCVRTNDRKPVGPLVAELAEMLGVTMPDMVSVPRDQDITLMEMVTLTELWQREVAKSAE